ncbi:hypothetical protein [Rhodococcus sp. (in: high G+C Gram-positive bacteria)]|uniref:hypothetical protein n=1 Tax=Rhodococcus sp. TaxID=1831 RepID=UPI001A30DCAD|nr:hypothetical protein [Rhodococcus sp. (in: high G+C Gram-positive bacteria)]MBJ7481552.1 hypothetical protein [Rhodococcus sp. (in: high G+C Gram-positive bacteria)]
MPKFRKKPVEVEAVQFDGSWPIVNGLLTTLGYDPAMPGDWIIRGVEGDLYPCKPDIFEQTYEAV